MSGHIDIQVERCRQIAVEGFDAQHDDDHGDGVLRKAAECYYRNAVDEEWMTGTPPTWPFEATRWKPGAARDSLVKAGALYMAEEERLVRGNIGGPVLAMLRVRQETCAWVIDFYDKNGRMPTKEERHKRHRGSRKTNA